MTPARRAVLNALDTRITRLVTQVDTVHVCDVLVSGAVVPHQLGLWSEAAR
jgi:hypothetical protein